MLAYFLLWQFRRGMTECSGCDSCALCLNVLLSFKRCLWLVLNNCHVLGLRLTGPFNGCVILKSKPSIDVRCLVLLTYRGSLRGSVPNSARLLFLFFFLSFFIRLFGSSLLLLSFTLSVWDYCDISRTSGLTFVDFIWNHHHCDQKMNWLDFWTWSSSRLHSTIVGIRFLLMHACDCDVFVQIQVISLLCVALKNKQTWIWNIF